jgi:hypothetical protein
MALDIEIETIQREHGKTPIKNKPQSFVHSHGNAQRSHFNPTDQVCEFSLRRKLFHMAIQHSGLWTGFVCMLFLALYADKISL